MGGAENLVKKTALFRSCFDLYFRRRVLVQDLEEFFRHIVGAVSVEQNRRTNDRRARGIEYHGDTPLLGHIGHNAGDFVKHEITVRLLPLGQGALGILPELGDLVLLGLDLLQFPLGVLGCLVSGILGQGRVLRLLHHLLVRLDEDIAFLVEQIGYLEDFKANENNALLISKMDIDARLEKAKESLVHVESKQYLKELVGTIGVDPLFKK